MTTKREKTKDYEFFFKAVSKAVKQCTGEDYKPDCLVADAAGSITEGFMQAMEYDSIDDFSRVVCFQHVKRNVDKHLSSTEKSIREKIKVDFLILQASQSKDLFKKACELFESKWKEKTVFMKYFKKVWLSPKRSGWYQGYAVAIPDHNNNNEADNRYIKEDQDRKRLGLIQFLNHAASNLVSGWSKRRRPESYEYIEFHTKPQLSLKEWTDAW